MCVFSALFELFYTEHISTKIREAFSKENKKETKLEGRHKRWKGLGCCIRTLLLWVGWFVPCDVYDR